MSLGSSFNSSQSPFGLRRRASEPAGTGESSAVDAPALGSLTAFQSEIVAVFADLVVLLGMPKSMGEIYGLVFASSEPPTFADIEQKLGLSKGSVSQGLRALRELGAIKEAGSGEQGVRNQGELSSAQSPTNSPLLVSPSRATHWIATTELRQLIGTLLRERLTPYLERQDQRMQNAEEALQAEASRIPAKDYKALKQRLEKLQTWQSRASTILPVLGKML